MSTREATDSEMMAAVERWARARGIWLEHGSSERGDSPGWHVGNFASPVLIWFIHKTKYSEGFTSIVDHHTALVWALLVETEATVDVGRCPACVKRGGPFEWRLSPTYHRYWDRAGKGKTPISGWTFAHAPVYGSKVNDDGVPCYRLVASRPCMDCNGTGRHTREAAKLVLDAAPRVEDDPNKRTQADEQNARDALHVEADRRSERGDPLGRWLALWLAGRREETAHAAASLDTPPATIQPPAAVGG